MADRDELTARIRSLEAERLRPAPALPPAQRRPDDVPPAMAARHALAIARLRLAELEDLTDDEPQDA